MTIFRVEIETVNAAFGDDEQDCRAECARILREIARKLEDNHSVAIPCYDINGNRVGSADFEKD